jgi:HK97 family phage portal protein
MALEEHGARLFSNGARPGGLFKYGKVLNEATLKRLREQLSASHEGGANSGRTMILEDGMSFEALAFNSVDSQFLELRQFAIAEIARIFRIPAHLLGDLSRSTNNNIEEQGRNFVQLCLLPIVRTWEDAISLSLLSADERKTYFAAFNLDDFQRADIDRRFAAYTQAVTNGILNPNECRALENRPAYPGGEVFTRQLNTAPTTPVAPAEPAP